MKAFTYRYDLRRSSLIMGAHPGCPVCSIVAASLVIVETSVGETISATKVAFVCDLWSVEVVALLSGQQVFPINDEGSMHFVNKFSALEEYLH